MMNDSDRFNLALGIFIGSAIAQFFNIGGIISFTLFILSGAYMIIHFLLIQKFNVPGK